MYISSAIFRQQCTAVGCDGLLCGVMQALKQELMYAMHLNVPSVLIELKGLNCVNLARIVSEHLLQSLSHLVGHLFSSHLIVLLVCLS